MPVDPDSLIAFGALAGRSGSEPAPGAEHGPSRPDPAPAARGLVRADLAALTGGLTGSLAGLRLPRVPSVEPTARRRLAALAGASVLAGLACGFLAPTAAEAGSATTAAPVRPVPKARPTARPVVLAASSSPFAAAARPSSRPAATPAATPAQPAASATPKAAPKPAPKPAAPTAAPRPAAASPAAAKPALAVAVVPAGVALPSPDPAWPHPTHAAPAVVTRPVYVPTRPLPAHSGAGRRIVYAERAAHLWIVGADGAVLRDYPVTGRIDRPKPGTYHVYSKSRTTSNPRERLTFGLMVRFAHGRTGVPIGFHTIPRYYDGRPIQSESQLGTPIGLGGCVRQSLVNARWLYAWSHVGDVVVVLR